MVGGGGVLIAPPLLHQYPPGDLGSIAEVADSAGQARRGTLHAGKVCKLN